MMKTQLEEKVTTAKPLLRHCDVCIGKPTMERGCVSQTLRNINPCTDISEMAGVAEAIWG